MAKGGKRGAAVVPGDAATSLLLKAIRQVDSNLKMPVGSKLTDAEVADFTAWIDAGAVWPKTQKHNGCCRWEVRYLSRAEKFWSLVPLQQPKVPAVKDAKWAKTDIDRFVLARLEKEDLKPVAPAAKRDLIRRATLDLTGLPATYEEIQAFEKDTSRGCIRQSGRQAAGLSPIWRAMGPHLAGRRTLLRRRLPNPQSESKGYRPYPNAYNYRDWVIQAFNDDLPFDQFVKAQIAGDLAEPQIRPKVLPATGFLGLGPWYYDNGAFEITRADERHDRVDAVTRGFLGLTVACARCHNHKYDPIPQTDYYSLAGVFYNTIYEEYPAAPEKVVRRIHEA